MQLLLAALNTCKFTELLAPHIKAASSTARIFSSFSVLSWKVSNMSASEKWKMEKEKFSTMPLEEKRKLYKDNKYVEVTAVPTWTAYYQKAKDRLQECLNSSQQTAGKYPVKPDLNNKVSIWVGNITHLEIDSIVNAANKTLMGGGGVDGAIHSAAGPSLKGECATLNGCDTGEAKITGGYLLPAKHVIHTVGPVGEKPEKLKSCYEKSLKLLTENKLRTVAFPCISTGIYGYPNEPAAHVAIGTARAYLEAHLDSVDRVIFCLFLQKDVEIYETLMQLYFPVEN